MTRPRATPWLIILLGAGFVTVSAWSFYRAAIGVSAVTDRDYYSHGLRYSQTQIEQRAADSLGWQVAVSREKSVLVAILSDRVRRPVTDARALLTLFRTDRPQPQLIDLQETAPGRYQGEFPPELHGELTAELAFERAGARLQRRILFAAPDR